MRKLFAFLLVFLVASYCFLPFTAAAATTSTGELVILNAGQVVKTGTNSFLVKAPSRQITMKATNGTFVEQDGHVYLETPSGSTEIKMDNVATCRTRGNYMDITMTADYLNVTLIGAHSISIMEVFFFDDGSWAVCWTEIILPN